MKFPLLSTTTMGKWATGLTLAFVVFLAIKMTTLAATIRLPLPTPAIAVIGMVGFIMGLLAFFRDKDRSVMVIITLVIGLLLTIWVGAEIIFPH